MNLLAALAIAITPLTPFAQVTQGDACLNWHASAQDANGNTLWCTHTPDSGHVMYWLPSIQDR
jgi:hypothetical protein